MEESLWDFVGKWGSVHHNAIKIFIILVATGLVHFTATNFEITRMEPILISFTEMSFLDFFDFDARKVLFRDYGPVFPMLLGEFQNLFADAISADMSMDIRELRYLPGFFLY